MEACTPAFAIQQTESYAAKVHIKDLPDSLLYSGLQKYPYPLNFSSFCHITCFVLLLLPVVLCVLLS